MAEFESREAGARGSATGAAKERYTPPKVCDYGTLRELTRSGNLPGPPDGIFVSQAVT